MTEPKTLVEELRDIESDFDVDLDTFSTNILDVVDKAAARIEELEAEVETVSEMNTVLARKILRQPPEVCGKIETGGDDETETTT